MAIKPPRLRDDCFIGILAPSSEIVSFPLRLARSLSHMSACGFRPKLAAHVFECIGDEAGTPIQRAEDFNTLIRDEEVGAILMATGGYSTNTILPYIDFETLRSHPKIVCGYSDATALLLAIHARCELTTFYGPMLLPSFGEFSGPFRYTIDHFLRVLKDPTAPVTLEPPLLMTAEFLLWDSHDVRDRALEEATEWTTVRHGLAEGTAVAANLDTLCRMVGTPFLPDLEGTVLFIEDDEGTPAQFRAKLAQLIQANIIDRIEGLVVGRQCRFRVIREQTLRSVLIEIGEILRVPILAEVDFGHTEPRLTIPIGARVHVDASSGKIFLLEGSVS